MTMGLSGLQLICKPMVATPHGDVSEVRSIGGANTCSHVLKCAMEICRSPYADLRLVFKSSLHNHQPTRIHLSSRIATRSFGVRLNTFRRSSLKSYMAAPTAARGEREVTVFDSEEELAVSLAKYTADLSNKICNERDSFTVVLSGGSLMKSLRKLLEPPLFESVDWAKWRVFWVDERVVAKNHPDSNYLLACTEFLSKVPIPGENVYAINDTLSAEGAADEYEAIIKHLVTAKVIHQSQTTGLPKFDLILLGMGPDGHVASLFPGHPLVQETNKWVTFIKDSPKPPPERITFTFPVINSAAHIAIVVAGSGKANAVSSALGRSPDTNVLPVQLVAPEGELCWFLDKGAASKL